MEKIINVVDAPCGYGKTSWAIQAMSEAPKNTHQFIYVTPFLDEVERVKESVQDRNFYEPTTKKNGDTKLDHLHQLLREGKDICTTHALFQLANKETRRLIEESNYTLILDEVLNVIQQVELKKNDLDLLRRANAISIEKKEGIEYIKWNEEIKEFDTMYNKQRNMALSGNLLYCSDKMLIWNLPCDMFTHFEHVYLLTYLFNGQLQRYYYDLHKLKYRYLSVIEEEGQYNLVPYDKRIKLDKTLLNDLISIYDGNLNRIGEKRTALSSTWLKKKENTQSLRKDAYNYLTNIIKGNSKNSLWTTLKHCEEKVKPRNFTTAFLSVNSRATNEYQDRFNLAYLVNRFMHPMEKKFFEMYGVKVNQETWALSELIQWIWRSRIRKGESINIYIPSARMRNLLIQYLNSEIFEYPPAGAITNQHSSDWNFA
jgi:hypothetical protein